MTTKNKTILLALVAGVLALLLAACGSGSSKASDPRNNTVYDHSELAWYIQQIHDVDEGSCEFYTIEFAQKSCLLARYKDSDGEHYVSRVFGPTIADAYRNESWTIESVRATDAEDTYNDKAIQHVEFMYGSSIIHMFIANGKSGKIERLFLVSDTADYHGIEGEFFIWSYDSAGNATGQFHSSGRFDEAFYGLDARGQFSTVYGDYYTFAYDADGRLQTSAFSSAQLKDNVVSDLKGGSDTTRTISFAYDDEGNRTNADAHDVSGEETIAFTRNSDGQVVQAMITMTDGTDTYKARIDVTYNEDGSVVYSDPTTE